MKIKKNFSNIFNIVLPDYNTNVVLDKLEELYNNKIFTKEIILNIIKLLIFAFNNNQNNYYNYVNLLNYFIASDNKKLSLFLQNLNLSYQFKLNKSSLILIE